MDYVMSDIHGNAIRYKVIMSRINLQPDDRLYVLGDVIDRGPDGINILLELMQLPNCTVLLGNHEYMFLEAIEHSNRDNFDLWFSNGGRVTYKAFLELSEDKKNEIIEFVKKMPYMKTISVKDKKFILAHGTSPSLYNPKSLTYYDKKEFTVWNRMPANAKMPQGKTVIFGHTPTCYYQEEKGFPLCIWRGENKIGIDCGSGYDVGRLACLRLDDMKEFYSE